MISPFSKASNRPGHGIITLSVLPPMTPILQTLSYQYPLKLIAPSAVDLAAVGSELATHQTPKPSIVHTVFILTYGGGLLPGDHVSLLVSVAPEARLILLTQGSTKIFKSLSATFPRSPSPSSSASEGSSQHMTVEIGDGAALCYLPDPVQPFADSIFEQQQTFCLLGNATGSLCVCDWVCEGRPARGESWGFQRYISTNEIWIASSTEQKRQEQGEPYRRLMLRDKVMLDQRGCIDTTFKSKVNGLGTFGTLILRGNLFDNLGQYFLDEFRQLPRIGGRIWESSGKEVVEHTAIERNSRHQMETEDGLLWTAAASRGNVVVKFGARGAEGARKWLGHMLRSEGTIESAFGERALLCLR